MKYILPITLAILASNMLYAQKDTINESSNAVYFELLGSAGYLYNVTYDRVIIARENKKISVALGVQIQDNLNISAQNTISPQINYVFGKKSRLELGFGYYWHLEDKKVNSYIFRFGYRYQKKNQPFFKIAFTPVYTQSLPIFKNGWLLLPYGGVAIGYSF